MGSRSRDRVDSLGLRLRSGYFSFSEIVILTVKQGLAAGGGGVSDGV